MIILSEQFGYKDPKLLPQIKQFEEVLNEKGYRKSIQSGNDKNFCFNISYFKSDEKSRYHFETSYFVGVDWIVENKLPIYVKPKLDDENSEVNYIQMLFQILKEPENYNYLDQLCEINFETPTIPIEQEQDILSPFLIIQYINILKKIVQKGLKKSYYSVTQNLNSRIKGKILINETIKKNHFNNKMLYNYCTYTELGINSIENKVLKKALIFSISAIQNLKGIDKTAFNSIVNYIQPAFENIDSEANIDELKKATSNQFYKDYDIAIRLAKLILKRFGYNITRASSTKINTPPFWIDMSKLFELYVFSKLKERFPKPNEVTYHKKFNFLEPDYIIKSENGGCKMIVDAKYKPRYRDNHVSIEDIRQICGYARLKKVYEFLELPEDKVIDCLIIYSNQTSDRNDFLENRFEFEKEEQYNNFHKIGITLPTH